mmetsp:Transcript_24077/g.72250  ORF Transcript_24077/g.72250 Transcript_24077/m.72250 type:complete len:387 (-) Transcript_24077:18-1178(-)
MGASHRRAGSRRSATKASGYPPWHRLPNEDAQQAAARRNAKRGRPTRAPAKKKNRRDAAAADRAPGRDAAEADPLRVLARWLAALLVGLAYFFWRRRGFVVLALLRPAAALEAPLCNRICRRNANFLDGKVCIGCFRSDDEIRACGSLDADLLAADVAERRALWAKREDPWRDDEETDDYGGFGAVRAPWTVLLDRDGVINRDVGSPGVVALEDFELLPGVAEAVRAAKARGCRVAVVTNQSARRKGLLSARVLDEIHGALRRAVPEIDAILAASGLEDGSPALKPAPDLLLAALEKFGAAPERAIMIGDARTDMVAAARANVRCALVTSSHHGEACLAELVSDDVPSVLGASGGRLYDDQGRLEARVDAVFPDLPSALEAVCKLD